MALVALVVALLLKQVPMRGLTQPGATDLGHGFAIPDQRTPQEQLEGQVVRIIRTRLPEAAAALLDSSRAGLDAVQVWTLRQIAIQQLSRRARPTPLTIAAAPPRADGADPAGVDDCIRSGLLVEHEGPGRASERGGSASRRSSGSCGRG